MRPHIFLKPSLSSKKLPVQPLGPLIHPITGWEWSSAEAKEICTQGFWPSSNQGFLDGCKTILWDHSELKQRSPEWYVLKRAFWGASDAAAIMGKSQYKNVDDIIKDRLLDRKVPLTDSIESGIFLEEGILKWAEKKYNLDSHSGVCVAVPELGLFVSYDSIVKPGRLSKANQYIEPLEIKNVGERNAHKWESGIPEEYYWQLLAQSLVACILWRNQQSHPLYESVISGQIVACIGGNRLKHYRIVFPHEDVKLFVERCLELRPQRDAMVAALSHDETWYLEYLKSLQQKIWKHWGLKPKGRFFTSKVLAKYKETYTDALKAQQAYEEAVSKSDDTAMGINGTAEDLKNALDAVKTAEADLVHSVHQCFYYSSLLCHRNHANIHHYDHYVKVRNANKVP